LVELIPLDSFRSLLHSERLEAAATDSRTSDAGGLGRPIRTFNNDDMDWGNSKLERCRQLVQWRPGVPRHSSFRWHSCSENIGRKYSLRDRRIGLGGRLG